MMRKLLPLLLCLAASPAAAQSTVTFSAFINALPSATSVGSTDQLYILQGNTNKKVSNSLIGGAYGGPFTLNQPVIGNGSSILSQGTRSGNTTVFVTANGVLGNGHCITGDVNGNAVDGGAPCVSSSSGVNAGTSSNFAFYAASGSVVSDSGVAKVFAGNAAVTSQIPQLPLPANNIAGSPVNTGQCLTSGGSALGGWQTCPTSNLLRNSSLVDKRCLGYLSWGFAQCDNIVTTAGGWCTEGIYIIPVGDSVTCRSSGGGGSFPDNAITMIGAASLTDIKLRFVQESYTSRLMTGHTVTFQVAFYNNSGAAFTPTFSTKYPTAVDNWSSSTADVPSVALNECAPTSGTGSACLLSYTFTPAVQTSGGTANGYEENIDLNLTNNASSGIAIIAGFGMNITDGLPGGAGAPPIPQILNPAWDHLWNQRFFQIWTNQAALNVGGQLGLSVGVDSHTVNLVLPFLTTMRAIPTMSASPSNFLQANGQFTTGVSFTNTTAASTIVSAFFATITAGTAYIVSGLGNTNSILADAAITGG